MKILLAFFLFLTGCTASVLKVGVHFLGEPATLPSDRVLNNLPYVDNGSPRHRLDLFLPKGTDWPTIVFVHGGSWTRGDKGMVVGGMDVYGNIGRYYASQGIGVAVINYRLQPDVGWSDQVSDVARATAWTYKNISRYGGNPQRLFLMGHSAGAQLVSHVALDPNRLANVDVPSSVLTGVMAISGAALDLEDAKTYELGASSSFYESRFKTDSQNWKREASPVSYINSTAPPFLVVYAEKETKPLKRQSERLYDNLTRNGVDSSLLMAPGQSHFRIVLALSHPKKLTQDVLKFINSKISG